MPIKVTHDLDLEILCGARPQFFFQVHHLQTYLIPPNYKVLLIKIPKPTSQIIIIKNTIVPIPVPSVVLFTAQQAHSHTQLVISVFIFNNPLFQASF